MTSLAVIKLRRGDTDEPECTRTEHRLRSAMGILQGMVAEPTRTHDPECHREWVDSSLRAYSCEGYHFGNLPCLKVEWPAWVTDDTLQMAYTLADKIITDRGTYNRADPSLRIHLSKDGN